MSYAPFETRITAFPSLRQAIRPEYESLSDPELANVVTRQLGISADLAENWLSDIGKVFQQVAPIARTILPFTGPWGMAASAGIGALSGLLGGGQRPTPGQPPGSPMPGVAAPPPGAAPAAGTIMQLLSNPAVVQALQAMLLGPGLGRQTVPVGPRETAVPVGEVANLIRVAANQAIAQYEAAGGIVESGVEGEELPEYLAEARQQGSDTGNALVRGVILAKLLDQPPVGYVPVTAAQPQTTVVYPPATTPPQPGVTTPTPAVVAPGAFEPIPVYTTPDLGIGQPIPSQSAERRAAMEQEFSESLDEIFDLGDG